MASWREILASLERIDIVQETGQAAENKGRELVALVQEQLIHGEDSLGNKLPKYSSNSYSKKKAALNSLPGFGIPDLRVSGKLYGDMRVLAENNVITVGSGVFYFPFMAKLYPNGFDLQNGNKITFRAEHLYPELRRVISQKTGLKVV